MVNKNQIKTYIDDTLKKGYSLEQIERALISRGYNPSEVKEVLSQYKKEQQPEIEIPVKKPIIEEPVQQPIIKKKFLSNKKLLVIGGLFLITLIIIFFAFFYKFDIKGHKEQLLAEEQMPVELPTGEQMPIEYHEKPVQTTIPIPDVNKIFNEDVQTCISSMSMPTSNSNEYRAYIEDDITLCDGSIRVEECKTNYQLYKALASKSCETISDPTSKSRIFCECLILGTPAQCEKVDFEYKPETQEDKNIFYSSLANHDSSNCDKISTKEVQEMCSFSVHITLALMNSDVEECKKLPALGDDIEQRINQCTASVTKDIQFFSQKDEKIVLDCKKKVLAQMSKDNYFSAQVCDLIEGVEEKKLCLDLAQEKEKASQ